jgi:hypothetical protein
MAAWFNRKSSPETGITVQNKKRARAAMKLSSANLALESRK